MKRVKITKGQYHIWKSPKALWYFNEETGELNPSEFDSKSDGVRNNTSVVKDGVTFRLLDCRNAIRAQIKFENEGQDCLILFFNGSVLGSTRVRKPSPIGIGISAGVPLNPEECPCKGWNGTQPGKHHSVCQHKDNWELMGANHRDRMNQVQMVPKYPIINTKPPVPGKRSPSVNASRFSEPVKHIAPASLATPMPSAEERKNNPLFQRQKALFGEQETTDGVDDAALDLTDASGNSL